MISRTSALTIALVGMLGLIGPSEAQAGLLGANIDACSNTVFFGSVTTDTSNCDFGFLEGFVATSAVLIDPGIEFSTLSGDRTVDFTDTTVTVRYNSLVISPSPDLFIFTGFPQGIIGVTLLTANPLAITTAFSGTSLALLISDPQCCGAATSSVTFQITLDSTVPEPVTVGLTGLGLAALMALKRRRS